MSSKLFFSYLFVLSMLMLSCENNFAPLAVDKLEFLDYHVTGGIAGFDNRFTVYADHRFEYHSDRYNLSDTLQQPTIDQITRAVHQHHFFSLQNEYLPKNPVNDDIIYYLEVHTSATNKRVVVSDAAAPESFRELRIVLDSIILSITSQSGKGVTNLPHSFDPQRTNSPRNSSLASLRE